MGQKVNPHGIRVGIVKYWVSKWYAEEDNYEIFELKKKEAKSRSIDSSSAKVKQFTRRVMRKKSTKRLILPRNRLA